MINLQQVISTSRKKVYNSSSGRPEVNLSTHGSWLERLSSMSNDSGVRVSERTALALTALYRGITLLAGSVATQPYHLFKRYGDKNKNKRIDRNHSSIRTINRRPNGYQNRFQFQFYKTVVMLLWGNYYAYISRNAFYEPVGLYPLAPWTVTPKVENGRKVFYVNGKRYNQNDIYHVYALSLDGIKGVRPISTTSQTIGLNLAAEKMQSSAYGRGLHAGGVITMPEEERGIMGSSDEEADQWMSSVRKSFKKIYQNGPDSWHEMMFLEPGWKFEQFKLNLETAQIIETRKMGIADIARLLGVPLHKLMELDKATKDNIEQQGIEYVQDGVLPITMNFEAEDNAKLLKESEKETLFFRYNLDGLMRADIKSRYEAYSTALGKNAPGFMSPEEIRNKEDLGDVDPEELFKPDNMNKQTFEPAKTAA